MQNVNNNIDNTLVKAKNKETDEIIWVIKNVPSRFIEGDEYQPIKRFPEDKVPKYLKRKSIIYHWK